MALKMAEADLKIHLRGHNDGSPKESSALTPKFKLTCKNVICLCRCLRIMNTVSSNSRCLVIQYMKNACLTLGSGTMANVYSKPP